MDTNIRNIILNIDGGRNIISQEVIQNTPERISTFYKEIFSGLSINPNDFLKRTFPVQSDDLILEKNITFYSMCEHHFLPFFGKIDIAYIPNGKIVGFGDLIKVVEAYSKRPQLQERMGPEIANTIFDELKCKGVYIKIEAEHLCMTMRGVRAPGTKIITTVSKGCFENEPHFKLEVINLLK